MGQMGRRRVRAEIPHFTEIGQTPLNLKFRFSLGLINVTFEKSSKIINFLTKLSPTSK